ncbi:MAG: BLUF domain-containing protein [Acidobacteriia bacterium]|nr:BLUF domain-containing protein [Terriglobia bacterium]
MSNQLYRIVYCSRNHIRGAAPEVEREVRNILLKARANNAAAGITGALLYNSGNFAQVLEGPVESIGRIFEKIQRDLRHSEVTVVENGRISERQFADWSMAFAGESTVPATPVTAAAFDAAFGKAAGAGEQIMDILRHLVLQEDDPILLGA